MAGGEVQDHQEVQTPTVEQKEDPTKTVEYLDKRYKNLPADLPASWEALLKDFDKHATLKDDPSVPQNKKAEFLRQSAHIRTKVLEFKYHPEGDAQGRSSLLLASVKMGERNKDHEEAKKAVADFKAAMRLYDSSDPMRDTAEYVFIQRALPLEKMFTKFEENFNKEKSRIQTESVQFIQEQLKDKGYDLVDAEVAREGDFIYITATKGSSTEDLQFTLTYDSEGHIQGAFRSGSTKENVLSPYIDGLRKVLEGKN